MLHACLYTICFVFYYTSWHFYAFSRTNLLMRCHSVSSLFSVVFVFQKSYIVNILGIGRNKSQSSYFFWHETESKVETGGPGARRTIGWCGPAPGCATRWCGPLAHLLMLPFRLYILLGEENLGARSIFTKHTRCRHCHRHEIGRVQKIFPAPCRRGNHHRRPSSSPCLPPEWCVSSLPWTTGP
jgi:hypothetical protein